MNAKQSLRAAAKQIEELEDWNQRASTDIKAYNKCIDGVIAGQCSFCDWCEEKRLGECEKAELGTGCGDWWLMDNPPVQEPEEGSADDDGKGILPEGTESGEGTETSEC